MRDPFILARRIALFLPLALIAGVWGAQLFGHLYPCELCHWQRWPHYVAIPVAALAFLVPGRTAPRGLVGLAAIAIAISGAIGVFHAGVEYHWWQGFTECTSTVSGHGGSGADILARIMAAPIIRCDVPQWTLGGVSLAGFNAILSLGGAGVIAWLLAQGSRR